MYEGKKVYGPYTRKDGRQIIILKTPGSVYDHQTISYPKYIVECALNRYLSKDETVDHINGDFTDNRLENLRVVARSIHCKSHITKRRYLKYTCNICGKEFYTTQTGRTTCGSKNCIGKCAHVLGYNKGNNFVSIHDAPEYDNLRNIVQDIPSVKEQIDN